ncbi:MAG TPA: hypothetical protein VNS50_05745, partial [Ginsengibacter sp.]|nr:hypothetical protein [Ginsengibacter sp.]
MKILFALFVFTAFSISTVRSNAQGRSDISAETIAGKNLYIDVHELGPGKVKYEDVAKAHAKDLAV